MTTCWLQFQNRLKTRSPLNELLVTYKFNYFFKFTILKQKKTKKLVPRPHAAHTLVCDGIPFLSLTGAEVRTAPLPLPEILWKKSLVDPALWEEVLWFWRMEMVAVVADSLDSSLNTTFLLVPVKGQSKISHFVLTERFWHIYPWHKHGQAHYQHFCLF